MTSDASLEDSIRERRQQRGVNAMTCYSVQFHLSNKTDVVLCSSLFTGEVKREEVWRADVAGKPLANENELKGMEIIMSEFSGLHHD